MADFVKRIEIRYSDMDALGHVNNAVYHTYLEDARIALMGSLGMMRDPAASNLGWILARSEVDFRHPARYGDTLLVHVQPGEIRNSSFEMLHRILRERDGRLIVEARSVQVCLDYSTERPVRIPDVWRARIAAAAA